MNMDDARRIYIDGMVKGMRSRVGDPNLPIEIHTHPDLAQTVEDAVEVLELVGVTIVADDEICVRDLGDGVKQSTLHFYVWEGESDG